jgi:GxxExxY protein
MGKIQTPYDELTYKIIGLAMAVHRELGPGFPEEMYQKAMILAMAAEAMSYESELQIPVAFRGQVIGKFKLDLVVDRTAVLELKALSALAPIHEQQLISYLTASGLPVGLLINFGAASLEHKRIFPPKAVQSSAAFQERRNSRTP